MQVNELLRMDLMAECLRKLPAFLVQEWPWSPSSSTNLPQRHFLLSKILATWSASDQVAMWLFCAASNRQCFQARAQFYCKMCSGHLDV